MQLRKQWMWALAIGGACGIFSPAQAALVGTRAQLNALLGGSGVTEDFEAYALATGAAVNIGNVYDATSTPNGQGPNLVVPGVRFTRPSNNLQLLGSTAFGGNSERLGWDSNTAAPISFDFLSPVTAFGVDVLTLFNTTGPTTVTIYGLDDTTVIDTFPGIVLNSNPQTAVFFGYENQLGIGRASFSLASGGPVFDDVTFGTVVVMPEPASAMLTVLGLAVLLGRPQRSTVNGQRPQCRTGNA